MKVFDVGGIALAMTLTFFIQTGVALLLIRHYIGPIGLGRQLAPGLKVLIGCAISAVPAYYLFQHIEASFDMSRLSLQFVGLALEASTFFVLYALFYFIFGREEVRTFHQLTKRRRDEEGPEMTMSTLGGGAP
jgi:peptidoglycan biosynthesis protein MviN/MurJ (putative lipid II flippase)